MRERIPQSTAKRITFDAYLASDHITAATGKTIAVTISKNGGAFAGGGGSANATEIGSGSYYIDLVAADTGTLGPLIFKATEGTIDPVKIHFEVADDKNSFADALLNRNVSGGSSTGRLVKQALHFIRNKWTSIGGTLTVYDTDDTTASWTSTVTSTAGADPITGNDPA